MSLLTNQSTARLWRRTRLSAPVIDALQGVMVRFFAIISSLLFSTFSQASEGIDINKLKQSSIVEIHEVHPSTKKGELVFVGIDVEVKNKELAESYIELSFVDKGTLHTDEYSKYAYERYIVSFNIVSGRLEKVVKGGWGSYQPVDNSVIK